MSTDLREPVEAAAVYQFGVEAARLGCDATQVGQAWDDAKPIVRHVYRESVLGAVVAAAPVIEAAVRAQIAAEIEADLVRSDDGSLNAFAMGQQHAASIARGQS